MPLFICDKCGVMENTARGYYWLTRIPENLEKADPEQPLCSQCASEDPELSGMYTGWHSRFERRFPDREYILSRKTEFCVSKRLCDIVGISYNTPWPPEDDDE